MFRSISLNKRTRKAVPTAISSSSSPVSESQSNPATISSIPAMQGSAKSDDLFALMNLEEIIHMHIDAIGRTVARASGFLRAHGLVGEIQTLLLSAFQDRSSVSKMAINLVAVIAKIRDSAKLANLTIIHIKDLIVQRMMSDTTRWDTYIKTVKLANPDLQFADDDLTLRLILEKPVTIDKWHLEVNSNAYMALNEIVSVYAASSPNIPPVNSLLAQGLISTDELKPSKKKNEEILETFKEMSKKTDERIKAIAESALGLSDAGYLIMMLVAVNLAINPEQLYAFIPQTSQIVTTGALHNHAEVMDKLATFLHAMLEIPSMFVLEAIKMRKAHLELFYGKIPELLSVREAEAVIDRYVPVDVFNVRDLAIRFLMIKSADGVRVIVKELIPTNLLNMLLSFNEKLRSNRKVIAQYEIDTLPINDIFQIPREIRAALYSTEAVTFERPFKFSDLKTSMNDYADALIKHVSEIRLQERCFHIKYATELSQIVSVDKLVPSIRFFLKYQLNDWPADAAAGESDSATYGALNPTSRTVAILDKRMSFSMGLASSIFSKINAVPSALSYDEYRLRYIKELMRDYSVPTVYYPAALWRGHGINPIEIFLVNIKAQFAQLLGLSERNFVELILTGDLGVPTIFSSMGVFTIDNQVVNGYGRPYGMSYKDMLKASTILDTIDSDNRIDFHYFNAGIEVTRNLDMVTLSVGRTMRYNQCSIIPAADLIKAYNPITLNEKDTKVKSKFLITPGAPYKQFALTPVHNHIVKPSILFSPTRFEGNDMLSIKDDAPPAQSPSGSVFMVTKPFVSSYGSDAWYLDKTEIPPILNLAADVVIEEATPLQKAVETVLKENVDISKSSIPILHTDEPMKAAEAEAVKVVAEQPASLTI